MDELLSWLSQQHHGLRTFKSFEQKAENLIGEEPEHRALYRLLANIVGSYIEAFDEEPLPSLDVQANADRRLADINRVAGCDLWNDTPKSQSTPAHRLARGCGRAPLGDGRAADTSRAAIAENLSQKNVPKM